jgi:short-subunit dehydrogenase
MVHGPCSIVHRHNKLMSRSTAIITGAGSGIGRGIAHALARRGYDVALVGRRAERLAAVARDIGDRGGRAVALPADLAVAEERRSVVERAREALGPVDVLVNNAGVLAGGDLSSLSVSEIERAVATNLLAPLELTRLALPDLAARKGSVVLIISSMSLVPLPYAAVYSATKAGVRAFGESLRYELAAQRIHLLVVCPPATDTAMIRGMAQASGLPAFPAARPAIVGEHIVRALMARKKELYFPGSDRALTLAYKIAPTLVRAILSTQRARFARMMGVKRET